MKLLACAYRNFISTPRYVFMAGHEDLPEGEAPAQELIPGTEAQVTAKDVRLRDPEDLKNVVGKVNKGDKLIVVGEVTQYNDIDYVKVRDPKNLEKYVYVAEKYLKGLDEVKFYPNLKKEKEMRSRGQDAVDRAISRLESFGKKGDVIEAKWGNLVQGQSEFLPTSFEQGQKMGVFAAGAEVRNDKGKVIGHVGQGENIQNITMERSPRVRTLVYDENGEARKVTFIRVLNPFVQQDPQSDSYETAWIEDTSLIEMPPARDFAYRERKMHEAGEVVRERAAQISSRMVSKATELFNKEYNKEVQGQALVGAALERKVSEIYKKIFGSKADFAADKSKLFHPEKGSDMLAAN